MPPLDGKVNPGVFNSRRRPTYLDLKKCEVLGIFWWETNGGNPIFPCVFHMFSTKQGREKVSKNGGPNKNSGLLKKLEENKGILLI